jgi:hypothetical protein
MTRGEPVIISDIHADARVFHDVYRLALVRSMVLVPVRHTDPIAVIGAYWSAPWVATAEQVRIIELLAEAAAVRMSGDQVRGRMNDVRRLQRTTP